MTSFIIAFFLLVTPVFFGVSSSTTTVAPVSMIAEPCMVGVPAKACPADSERKKVEKVLYMTWDQEEIRVGELPEDSEYSVVQASPNKFELYVRPNVGDHYLQEPNDFYLMITVQKHAKADDIFSSERCFIPKYGVTNEFDLADHHVSVSEGVDYSYDGPSGGNPNPFTTEVTDILKKVTESIRIGTCKE